MTLSVTEALSNAKTKRNLDMALYVAENCLDLTLAVPGSCLLCLLLVVGCLCLLLFVVFAVCVVECCFLLLLLFLVPVVPGTVSIYLYHRTFIPSKFSYIYTNEIQAKLLPFPPKYPPNPKLYTVWNLTWNLTCFSFWSRPMFPFTKAG